MVCAGKSRLTQGHQSAPEYGLIVWSRPKKEGAMKATNRFSVHFLAIVLLSLLQAMPLSVRAACLTGLNAADCDLLNAATADVSSLATSSVRTSIIIRYTGLPVGNSYIAIQASGPIDFSQITDTTSTGILSQVA